MPEYLREAAYLAAETPHNRCPATDALAVLDAHPEIRLVLEDTWTDQHGRVYREVPADRISHWPTHIARAFRSFLRISKDPAPVFRLLDLLHQIDADQAVVQMTLSACRKRKSLLPAIEYFEKLAAELDTVTRAASDEEVPLGTRDPRCRPRFNCGEVSAGRWYLAEGSDDPEARTGNPYYRAEILHDPTAPLTTERDGIESQPRSWRALHWQIRQARSSDLPAFKTQLLSLSEGSWSHDQLHVLWDAYRMRRDALRRKQECVAAQNLGLTARKLIHRIRRARSRPQIAWVGMHLFRCMRGELPLPGPVSRTEWGVVFSTYRTRKAELPAHA